MDAWMNSPGHRANLVNGNFTEVGVARVGNYWTQVFGTPQKSPAATPNHRHDP